MRSYKAARRAVLKEPVAFEVEYVDGNDTEQKETFTCKGEVSSLLLSELAYNANVDVATEEGMALLREFFAQVFGDDAEYQRFFRFSLRHLDDDQVMDIMAGLVEDFSGRPTERPSDSPATPSSSGPASKVVSLSKGTVVTQEGEAVDPKLQAIVEKMASSA